MFEFLTDPIFLWEVGSATRLLYTINVWIAHTKSGFDEIKNYKKWNVFCSVHNYIGKSFSKRFIIAMIPVIRDSSNARRTSSISFFFKSLALFCNKLYGSKRKFVSHCAILVSERAKNNRGEHFNIRVATISWTKALTHGAWRDIFQLRACIKQLAQFD